jgi:hypothetical protein
MKPLDGLVLSLVCVPYLGMLVPAHVRWRLPSWSADAVGVYGLVVMAGYAAAVGVPALRRLRRRRWGLCPR